MSTQTTRPQAGTAVQRAEQVGRPNRRFPIAITAFVATASIAIGVALAVPGHSPAASDDSWQQAELNRMTALEQTTDVTSSHLAGLRRQLALANDRADESSDIAEFQRHSSLAPVDDTSHHAAENARQRAFAPQTDMSHDVAEFERTNRLTK